MIIITKITHVNSLSTNSMCLTCRPHYVLNNEVYCLFILKSIPVNGWITDFLKQLYRPSYHEHWNICEHHIAHDIYWLTIYWVRIVQYLAFLNSDMQVALTICTCPMHMPYLISMDATMSSTRIHHYMIDYWCSSQRSPHPRMIPLHDSWGEDPKLQ